MKRKNRQWRVCLGLLPVVLFMLAGCVKNEVQVEIKLPAEINDAYKIVYYASDPTKGWFVETVAVVQKGEATLKCITRNPTLVYIMGQGSMPRAVFYAERGDKIKISGKNSNPLSWSITGNKITEELTAWRLSATNALQTNDVDKVNKAVADYVSANAENPVSTLLLLTYYDRRADEQGFASLWNKLKGKALEPKWIQLVSRADMLGDEPHFQADAKEMILHTLGNGVDTLRFHGHPTILYFWRRDDSSRAQDIDTVRKLSKEFPDSAARIVSDISFDADSVGWMTTARQDSLRRVVRGWNFRAESDSLAMRMGVTRTPWFVVIDNKGKQKYGGDDNAQAAAAFRTLKSNPKKK